MEVVVPMVRRIYIKGYDFIDVELLMTAAIKYSWSEHIPENFFSLLKVFSFLFSLTDINSF